MSQHQTVRITTTETTSALVINTGYFKTAPGLLKLAQFVNIFVHFQLLFFHFRNWLFSLFLICCRIEWIDWTKIDFGMHLRRHNCLSFQWSPYIIPIWTVLLFDVRYILDMHNHFIIIVFNFMEHWWHHIKDNLCE